MARKPNVILCACDELRAFALGAYGNGLVKTPNIDRLAREGLCFKNAVSNTPLCVPARSSLISGQHARTCTGTLKNIASDIPDKSRIRNISPSIAEVMKQQDYKTALIGKWHIFTDPMELGFDYALYPLVYEHFSKQIYIENSTDCSIVREFGPEFEITRVENFIAANRDEPFFLFYNITPPHMPLFDVPEKYRTMYDPGDIKLRENTLIDGQYPHNDKQFNAYLYNLFDERKLPESLGLQELTALYYGLVSLADNMVGKLIRALEKNTQLEDTLIVFTSDHGDELGSHHQWGKNTFYEESVRIPMIFRGPGIVPNHNCSRIAQLIDILPTLAEYVGGSVPPESQGRSLLDTTTENPAIIETSGSLAIRTLQYKYAVAKTQDKEEYLYDLHQDPCEMQNLAAKPDYQTVKTELRKILTEWDASTPILEVKEPGLWNDR